MRYADLRIGLIASVRTPVTRNDIARGFGNFVDGIDKGGAAISRQKGHAVGIAAAIRRNAVAEQTFFANGAEIDGLTQPYCAAAPSRSICAAIWSKPARLVSGRSVKAQGGKGISG
jgi:hypothetical protein